MNICFITNGVVTQHATMKRAFAMAPALLARGHAVTLVAEDAPDNQAAARDVPRATLLTYSRKGSAHSVRTRKERLVRPGNYDVVHICGLGWRNRLRPLRLNSPRVVMDHVEIESTLRDSGWVRRWLQARLENWSLQAYDAHIGASRYLETWLRQHLWRRGLARPLLWLPYANDHFDSAAGAAGAASLRAAAGEKKILLYFGNFYRQYGFWELLEAAKELGRRRRDFVLVLAGRGREQAAGEQFIRAQGLSELVQFAGYLQGHAARAQLHAAHASLVPLFDTETDWARCPGKLFIGMGSGRPIITGEIGEARECFTDRQFFCDFRRLNTVVDAMARALDTPLAWHPNYQRELHTWERRVEKWLDWMASIAK